jgi:hypothetical protein
LSTRRAGLPLGAEPASALHVTMVVVAVSAGVAALVKLITKRRGVK